MLCFIQHELCGRIFCFVFYSLSVSIIFCDVFSIIWHIWSQNVMLVLDLPFRNISSVTKTPLYHHQAETLISSKEKCWLILLSSQGLITVIHSSRDFQNMLLGNCNRHLMLPWEFSSKSAYLNALQWRWNFKIIWIS